MTTTKHTPTPWQYEVVGVSDVGPNGVDVCEINANGHVRICEYLTAPNAAHIVRCVNAHDDLVAALDVIANAATVGGISAGERNGLARAAAIAAAAIAKVTP